jgi:uncharacterized protein (DUF885 family)
VSALTDDELVTRGIIAWLAARGLEGRRFFWFSSNVTPYAAPVSSLYSLFGALPLATAPDRDRYLRLTAEYPRLLRSLRARLEGQIARKLVLPLPEVEVTVPMWRAFRRPAREHPLWVRPARLAGVAEADRARFEEALARILDAEVDPAIRDLTEFLEGPYRAAAPPDGWRRARPTLGGRVGSRKGPMPTSSCSTPRR